MSITRPKPTRSRIRLEVIERNPKLQLRSYRGDELFDPQYVEHLLDLHAQGTVFDPLEIVEEDRGPNRQPNRWLLDGFNRAAMYDRAEVGTVEVLIYPGTFRDAELWALASNARHGRPRTPEDCRKAFDRLMGSRLMLEQVIAERGKFHGTERALAAACGISHGAVGKYLKELNVHADRLTGKLVPNDGPASPEREARRQLVDEATANGTPQKEIAAALGVDPVTVRKDQRANRAKKAGGAARAGEKSAPEPAAEPTPAPPAPRVGEDAARQPEPAAEVGGNPLLSAALTELEAVGRELRSVARRVNSLLKSPLGCRLRAKARAKEVPLLVKEKDGELSVFHRPGDPMPGKVRTENWPAFEALQAVFAELVNDLAADAAQEGFGRGD